MTKEISRRAFMKALGMTTVAGAAAGTMGLSGIAAAEEGKAVYTPGTYTGTAQGMGTVTVTMTFSETAITDVAIDCSGETAGLGDVAANDLKTALLSAQSAEIDGVTGATITSNAVKKAAASCIEQAMGVETQAPAVAEANDDDWLGKAPEIDESKVEAEVLVDVAVVGCGLAGVAACRAAAEQGAKVAAFDKASCPQCRSGEFAVLNGNVQARWGRNTWTREQIDEIVDAHMSESTYRVKRPIMSKWAHNIGEAFDWWVAADPNLYICETTRSAVPDENAGDFLIPIFYPLPEHYDWTQERFPCYPTSVEFKPDQSATFNANMQKAIDTGCVETFYGHFVEKLIMENGRCVGLYARNAATGGYVKCMAAHGVILSTGDYSQNTKMLKHFCPEVIENNIMCLFTSVDVEGKFTNMGDGIQLGAWAGAKIQQSHAPMIHHMCRQKSYIADPISKKKVKNKGVLPRFYYQNCHEGILDRDTWEKAQAEYERRRKKLPPPYCFTRMITCGVCGMPYTRRSQQGCGRKTARWFCRATKEKGMTCSNAIFAEEHLKRICAEVLDMEAFDEQEFLNRVRHMTVTPDGIDFDLLNGKSVRWKNRHIEDWHHPATCTDAFLGRIRCGCCGAAYHRFNYADKAITWYCMGQKQKWADCPSRKYADFVLRQIVAELMGTDDFDEAAFLAQADHITAGPGDTVTLHFKDGRTAQWQRTSG